MSTEAVAVLLIALAGCSDEPRGAVSFRWRVVDKTSGAISDPRDYPDANGGCVCVGGQGANCQFSCGWSIDRVQLHVSRLGDGGVLVPVGSDEIDPAELIFDCRQEEATTESIIPSGQLFFSVDGVDDNGDDGDAIEAFGPPGVLRTVVDAQVVNLDVVELVPRGTLPPGRDAGDGRIPGVLDLGCP